MSFAVLHHCRHTFPHFSNRFLRFLRGKHSARSWNYNNNSPVCVFPVQWSGSQVLATSLPVCIVRIMEK